MWLYVPNTSTSSPSAPEAAASISASSWQFQALEQSAWWRGKPSPSRTWFQRWRTVYWVQLLFGAMPEPSMAAVGVERLTASLAASRASHTAWPASGLAKMTNATSGAPRAASSSSPARGSSSSRMSGACSPAAAHNEFGEIFADWALRLREDCSRRRKLARAMSENGCSSSQWPTPATRDHKGANGQEHLQKGAGRLHLDQLPNYVQHLWTTPSTGDGQRGGTITERMSGTSLTQQVNTLWSTPRATDGEKGGPNQSFRNGTGLPLTSQAHQWRTPRSSERGQYQYDSGDKAKPTPTLTGQAFSHLDRETSTHGETSSPERRSLNPLFVEWLMGWPLGWTSFACSATALSRYKQRMRSALSQLAWPSAGPPAQLALFA